MIGFTMVLPWFYHGFTMVSSFHFSKIHGKSPYFPRLVLIYRKHNLPRVKPRCQYVISFKNGVMQKKHTSNDLWIYMLY